MTDTNKINELIGNKEFKQAEELLVKALKEEPDNIEFIKLYGLVNVNLEKWQEARSNFETVVKYNPEDAVSWFYLANCYDKTNDLISAKNTYFNVIKLRPEYIEAYKNLCIVLIKQNEIDAAIKYALKASTYDSNDYIFDFIIGTSYMKLKEFAKNSFGAVRTREIAALAGVNHAAISYYFGGKKELYKEIARQVVDFIEVYSTPYFERAKAIYKSKSRADAQNLIRDYVMSRVCAESEKDGEILRCMIMIITREEMYQTEIFDIFYNGAFKPSGDMMLKLVEIASDGRYSGESAMVVSEMIMGQVHMFNSARAGFKRMNKWKTFGEREISVVRDKFSEMLGRIFA